MIVTILRGKRPLCRIDEFWKKEKPELMLEENGIAIEQLNDDAFGRALDKLQTVNMKEMVSNICLTMLKAHDVPIESLHFDTTSVSVEGAYENEDGEDNDFVICHGHSKDLRPDLKQFKIGAAVQQDGLPVMGELLSGNASDREWNPKTVQEMKRFF